MSENPSLSLHVMLLLDRSFFTLFWVHSYSFDFPLIPPTLPSGTWRLAFDEDRNLLIAFNRLGHKLAEVEPLASNLARRDGSACTPLDVTDLQNREQVILFLSLD